MRTLIKSQVRLPTNLHQFIILLLVKHLLTDGELVVGDLVESCLELVEVVLAAAYAAAKVESFETLLAAPESCLVK